MIRLWLGIMVLAGSLLPLWGQAADEMHSEAESSGPLQVSYFQRTIKNELSDYERYWVGLLEMALQKSGRSYELNAVVGDEISHGRINRSLEAGGPVSVAYMGTSTAVEATLMPIRIPVFRGLLGYRIMMTNDQSDELFQQVNSIVDLKKANYGLGLHWADVPIMKDAGLTVTELNYKHLFQVLASHRVHAVSRAAHEITGEFSILSKSFPNLRINQDIVLAYRQASYFFVGPHNKVLADTIEMGLENAYADGSFMTYFNGHPAVQSALKLLNGKQRKTIWIENHHLSPETRSLPDRYGFSPAP